MAVTLKFSDLDLVSTKCWFSAQLGSKMAAMPGYSEEVGRPFFRLLSQVLLSKGWSGHVPAQDFCLNPIVKTEARASRMLLFRTGGRWAVKEE